MSTPAPRPSVYDELLLSLVWPKLFRAPALALRPARIALGLFLLIALALVLHAGNWWVRAGRADSSSGSGFYSERLPTEIVAHRLSRASDVGPLRPAPLLEIARIPIELFREHPGLTIAMAVPAGLILGILGGAIARSAATEHGPRIRTSVSLATYLVLRRWLSHGASLLMPLALAGALAGLLACAGYLALRVPHLSVLGALAYPIGLALGACVVIVLMATLLTFPMLVAAVLIEGTDAVDSVQRCFAYLSARPLRFLLYSALLIVLGVLVAWLLAWFVDATLVLTSKCVATFLPDGYDAAVRARATHGSSPAPFGAPAWQTRATTILAFWARLVRTIPLAFLASYVFSAGSCLYLAMRRVCDGQDEADVWMPSQDPRTTPPARVAGSDEDDAL